MIVDHTIGDWIVSDDNGNHAIAIVKDIDGFCKTIHLAMQQRTLRSMSQKLNELIDCVEFAEVNLQKNGTVKWNRGNFVNSDGI